MIAKLTTALPALALVLFCSGSLAQQADAPAQPAAPAPPAAATVQSGSVPTPMEVKITPDLPAIEVMHNGAPVKIMRNQDPNHVMNPAYTRTSRKCPPFCVQPAQLYPGVETIGEIELLN